MPSRFESSGKTVPVLGAAIAALTATALIKAGLASEGSPHLATYDNSTADRTLGPMAVQGCLSLLDKPLGNCTSQTEVDHTPKPIVEAEPGLGQPGLVEQCQLPQNQKAARCASVIARLKMVRIASASRSAPIPVPTTLPEIFPTTTTSSTTTTAPPQTTTTTSPPQQFPPGPVSEHEKQQEMAAAGISSNNYFYAEYIGDHESQWCATRIQGYYGSCPSTAPNYIPEGEGYGWGQATPPDKMASYGDDWKTNIVTQLKWANDYAKKYGGWYGAYEHWQANQNW